MNLSTMGAVMPHGLGSNPLHVLPQGHTCGDFPCFQEVGIERSLDMPYFVFKGLSEQFGGLYAHLFAVQVQSFGYHGLGALDFAAVAGDAQTAFVDVPFTGLPDNLRVNQRDDGLFRYAYNDDGGGRRQPGVRQCLRHRMRAYSRPYPRRAS